jgi:F0F1-type ATP synthase membrane subunit b/b'
MFKLFSQRHNKDNHDTNGASIRSLIQRAVRDAEQITDSIKMRAQAEAESEAARTIDQARQGAEEIKRSAEAAAQKEAEGILSVASRRAEVAETEAKKNVRLLLLKARQELAEEIGGEYKQVHSRLLSPLEELINEGQDEVIEQPVQLEGEAVNEKVEEPLQVEEEATLSEPVGATTEEPPEQHLSEEKPGEEDPETTQLKWEDSQALYTGEIELAVAAPVELKVLTKFYNYLQTTPDIKILYTRGSWDSGTTITIALDNPIPLISFISQIPGVAVVPELFQKDNPVRETPSSLLRARRNGVKRLKLALKEE